MVLLLKRDEAVIKLREYLKTQSIGGGFFGAIKTADELLSNALEQASPFQLESLINQLGGAKVVFGLTDNLKLQIKP